MKNTKLDFSTGGRASAAVEPAWGQTISAYYSGLTAGTAAAGTATPRAATEGKASPKRHIAGPVPNPFSHRMMAQEPIRSSGGLVRITDSSIFPASKTIAAALVEVEPGGMRELHWHPNADEWQFYISSEAGEARMTVFNFQAGDIGVVPFAMGHYVENIGDSTLRFLEIFRSDRYADISLRQWLAFTPSNLVRAHLEIEEAVFATAPEHKTPVVAGLC